MKRSLFNLQASRTAWFQIKAQDAGPTVVNIYDEVGIWGVSAQDFVNDLAAVKGPVEVHLSTPGGEIFDGLAIYQALKARGDVAIVIDALAASIGSVIAMAAAPGQLSIAKNASMMIHDGWGMTIGNAADMQQTAAILEAQSANIASIYAERTGKPAADWRAAMQSETWYIGQAAVDAGLADKLTGATAPTADQVKIAASWDLSIYAHAPANLFAATGEPYRPQPYSRESYENVQCPACSKFGDDDASYCGQCGTKLAGREDVVEEHGAVPDAEAHKPPMPATAPAASALVTLHNADVAQGSWDGSAAMSAAAKSADPAAAFNGICAGRKAGDPSLESSWALPHHEHAGDPPNGAGVRNALSRLPQTEGLTNEAAAKAHLEAHMKDVSPEPANIFRQALLGPPAMDISQHLKGVLAI